MKDFPLVHPIGVHLYHVTGTQIVMMTVKDGFTIIDTNQPHEPAITLETFDDAASTAVEMAIQRNYL